MTHAAATTVAELLESIGFGKENFGQHGTYEHDYRQNLADNGFETLAQLQFATTTLLQECGIKAGHAAEIVARLKDTLGRPPVRALKGSRISPAAVFICLEATPAISQLDPTAMVCAM